MENQELALVVKENNLAPDKTEYLLKSFGEHFKMAKEIAEEARSIKVVDESETDKMQKARRSRLELRSIRTEVDKVRVSLKEQSLREGRAIDGMANIIKALIVPVEEYLESQEKFAEVLRQKREEAKSSERVSKLSPYVEDITLYNLKEMSDYAFEKLLESSKNAYEAQKAAEKKAEEERIAQQKAEQEEQERIRKENEQLKLQAEQKEKELADKERIQQENLKAEREEQEAKLAKERAAREKVEKELREKEEAELKRKQLEEEEKKKALLAPDKDKLLEFATQIDKMVLPRVSSKEAGIILDKAESYLGEVAKFIREKAKTL